MIRKFSSIIAFILLCSLYVCAQKANGSVKSLIEVDEKLNYLFFKSGIPNAFLKYADENALVFQPGPVSLNSIYKKTKDKSQKTFNRTLSDF